MTPANVRTNPLSGDTGTEGILGSDPGLQLVVSSGEPRGGDVPGAELSSSRTDMLYGSFRAGFRYIGEGGTCGAFFFVSR